MPKFTIETTYHLPVYRHRTYEAETLEQACDMAIDDDDWFAQQYDFDSAGDNYITGIWDGPEPYDDRFYREIPPQYHEMVQRKAKMFDEMLAALRMTDTLFHAMTDHAYFDIVAEEIHPDVINRTCDVVAVCIKKAETITSIG